jgi:hypothetical protein
VIEMKLALPTCIAIQNPIGPGWAVITIDGNGKYDGARTNEVNGYTKEFAMRKAKNMRRRLSRQRVRKLAGK